MKTELAPTSSDLSLLPRADLPVIWDGFKAKAEELRNTAETLTVTTIEQKAEMELARTTRLTLKQIRVEVEKKRIELGEGHLTEIQKINGAAKKLKELIEPLEARLLVQETFAERVEADRLVQLEKTRNDEVRSIRPGTHISGVSYLSQTEYDAVLARLRAEVAEIEEAKRKQAEAEALAAREREAAEASRRQMQAQLDAQQAEAERQRRAAAAEAEIRLAAERAELQRQNERVRREYEEQRAKDETYRKAREVEAERIRAEQEEKFRAEQAAASAQRTLEREAAEKRRQEDLRIAEAKRLELEVQLANERAAKLAEERRLHALAVAPDKEQLREFHRGIYNIPQPDLKTCDATMILNRAQGKLAEALLIIDVFLAED